MRNLKRFNDRMRRIPLNVRRAAQEKIDQNADELVALQKSYAPEDEGDLVESIRSEPLPGERVGRLVMAGGSATTRPVRNGQSATFDYALAQEFGTEDVRPGNYFFGPYRLKKRAFKSRITRAIKKAMLS